MKTKNWMMKIMKWWMAKTAMKKLINHHLRPSIMGAMPKNTRHHRRKGANFAAITEEGKVTDT